MRIVILCRELRNVIRAKISPFIPKLTIILVIAIPSPKPFKNSIKGLIIIPINKIPLIHIIKLKLKLYIIVFLNPLK